MLCGIYSSRKKISNNINDLNWKHLKGPFRCHWNVSGTFCRACQKQRRLSSRARRPAMTRSATSTTIPGSTVLGQFVRSLISLVKALRDRREVKNLAEFDDRMLKDIGLLRSDVDSALAQPFLRNPSWVLVRCVERHSRGERTARPVRPVVPLVKRSEACA
jgi:uncharacterized protein YjiS (DUF1127 family)